jgi:murein DD-endopeptidase MepM/ murein hydrolase activator NlpD
MPPPSGARTPAPDRSAPAPPGEPVAAAAPMPAMKPDRAPPAAATPATPEAEPAALPPPLPGGKGFVWPVEGRVLGTFGEGPGGTHNDGINIAAAEGTPVVAAETGVVAYTGNELRGFGNLVLIKHAGGWMTAYAHNQAVLVKRGDTVKRGQMIARVGATGAVGEPQLHFEMRRGTRALDPMAYLPAARATAVND